MSTINRLLSRRDKHHGPHKDQPKHHGGPLNGLFVSEERRRSTEKHEKGDDKKLRDIRQRLIQSGIKSFKDEDIAYVLDGAYSQGDTDKAYELLVLLENSEEGIIRNHNPNVKLLGAVNREGVTCYLDALLFAMFARLASFEAMLYQEFEDAPRKRLASLLRLWINILRAGKLITTDITKQIQLQLSDCGWKDAAELHQQDASEAFTFITSTLALPLLTLKMDIFHTGKEDVTDDHKFINERLLELAIPDDPQDGHSITLEECLELFFNNKIEVKRYLDQLERRNTLRSLRSRPSVDSIKAHASHIEVAEIKNSSQPSTPVISSTQPSVLPELPASPTSPPVTPSPQPSGLPDSSARPILSRKRAPSIIQEHYISEKGMLDLSPSLDEEREHSPRVARVRKEVMMPAWQFFSLIPWYTDNVPSNDAQVAAHFSSTRPILGICLKRYSMLPNGTASKRTTHVDIPLEIGLPHFIQDDKMSEDGPAFGNFKLSLQSVICHQGVSVESGHYISLVRTPDPVKPGQDRWMRFDDLATERVTYTDVEAFLLQESPYLLFYQVIPIEDEMGSLKEGDNLVCNGEQLPSYAESNNSLGSKVDSGIEGLSSSTPTSNAFSLNPNVDTNRPSIEISRISSDMSTSDDGRRGRSSDNDERRRSIALSDPYSKIPGAAGASLLNPPNSELTQNDGPNSLTLSRRGSNTQDGKSKTRPSSQGDPKRLSTSLSRLASRMSRDRLNRSRENLAMTSSASNPPAQPGTQVQGLSFPNQTTSKHIPNGLDSAAAKTSGPSGALPDLHSVALMAMEDRAEAAHEKPPDRGRLKKEAKEKSKAAQREHQHLMKGKRKEDKPDRECSVM